MAGLIRFDEVESAFDDTPLADAEKTQVLPAAPATAPEPEQEDAPAATPQPPLEPARSRALRTAGIAAALVCALGLGYAAYGRASQAPSAPPAAPPAPIEQTAQADGTESSAGNDAPSSEADLVEAEQEIPAPETQIAAPEEAAGDAEPSDEGAADEENPALEQNLAEENEEADEEPEQQQEPSEPEQERYAEVPVYATNTVYEDVPVYEDRIVEGTDKPREVTKTVWETSDGVRFDSEDEAHNHAAVVAMQGISLTVTEITETEVLPAEPVTERVQVGTERRVVSEEKVQVGTERVKVD